MYQGRSDGRYIRQIIEQWIGISNRNRRIKMKVLFKLLYIWYDINNIFIWLIIIYIIWQERWIRNDRWFNASDGSGNEQWTVHAIDHWAMDRNRHIKMKVLFKLLFIWYDTNNIFIWLIIVYIIWQERWIRNERWFNASDGSGNEQWTVHAIDQGTRNG